MHTELSVDVSVPAASLHGIEGEAVGAPREPRRATVHTRKRDADQLRFMRADQRLVTEGGFWHVHTREGLRGPFVSREAAALELSAYIGTMEFLEDHADLLPPGLDLADVTIVYLRMPSCF